MLRKVTAAKSTAMSMAIAVMTIHGVM